MIRRSCRPRKQKLQIYAVDTKRGPSNLATMSIMRNRSCSSSAEFRLSHVQPTNESLPHTRNLEHSFHDALVVKTHNPQPQCPSQNLYTFFALEILRLPQLIKILRILLRDCAHIPLRESWIFVFDLS
jgi:hypothetical protein